MADWSDKQLGKYKIKELLGRGGMGAVYKAFQPGLERDVAIKTIHPHLVSDPNAIKRFRREAKIVARLRHPSIVQVHDFDVEDDTFYMVMEFVPGETLEKHFQAIQAKGERLPLNETLRLFQSVTRAVAYAHAQDVSHQDLKPANVLLTQQGQPVLADFGLSRIVGAEQLETPGTVSGTPQYMSPEQCSGQMGDMRSDVYSLGVMLYELTTGSLPFSGKTAVGLILKHISETPPGPRLLNPDLPAAIEAVILKTLEKDPANRYPSAQELLEAVEDIVAPVALLDEEEGLPLDDRCPYRGLQAFEEEHAEFYFGREALLGQLSEKLKQTLDAAAKPAGGQASRFLAVLGASGSGKSSLVQAGLLPALRAGALPGSAGWVIRVMKPGSRPLEELANQLAATLGGEDRLEAKDRLLNQLAIDGRTLHLLTRMAWGGTPPEHRLLLVVDQFEELFTLCHDEAARQSFIENLLYVAAVGTGRGVILLTMRADFYHRCAAYRDLANRVSAQQLLVGPMSEAELQRAIEQPAQHVGLRFEAGLVDAILSDVAQEPGALPLLQHALLELWAGRYGRLLMLRTYQASGGVSGAIAQRAETLYADFNPDEQVIVRRVMLRLTQPGEGSEDTRRRARRSELLLGAAGAGLDDSQIHAETVEQVLQQLADARLITTTRDIETGVEYVDVAHEALIRGWTRLREWIDQDRESLRTHRRLTEVATEWERYNRDESYLYRGARLAEAEEWGEAHRDELNLLEHEFLQASVTLRDQEALAAEAQRQHELKQAQTLAETERQRAEEQARATHRLRRLALALAAVFLVAVGAAILAWTQQRRAETNEQLAQKEATAALAAEKTAEARRAEAEAAQQTAEVRRQEAIAAKEEAEQSARTTRAGQLAAQAQTAALEGYPQRSLLLAAEALNINLQAGEPRLPAAENVLRQILANTGGRSLIGQDDLLTAIALSPDHHWLATAGGTTAHLWNVSMMLDTSLTTSPTGDSTTVPIILTGHNAPLTTIAVSPIPFEDGTDSRWVVTGDESGLVRLWHIKAEMTAPGVSEVERTVTSIILTGHNASITAIVVSPDNRWLATGSADTTVRLWDVSALLETGLNTANASVPAGPVAAVPSIFLTTHQVPVTAMAISHAPSENGTGNNWLVTGDESGLAYLWNASAILDAGSSTLLDAGSSTLLDTGLATTNASSSGSLVAPSAALTGHKAAITTIAISPAPSDDGTGNHWIATGSDDATTRLWDLTASDPTATSIVLPSQSFITALAISASGHWLVTGSWDDTARLWDLTAPDPAAAPIVLRGHDKPIFSVAISPDDHWVVTGSSDRTARLWDLTTPDPAAASVILRGHEDAVVAVSIGSIPSADGSDKQGLITGSSDATVRQWDLGNAPDSSAAAPIVLRSHTDSPLTAIAVSPAPLEDGTGNHWLVAGTDGDNTVNLWNLSALLNSDSRVTSEATAPIVLTGHEAAVTAIAVSPPPIGDGSSNRWLATGDRNGGVRLWDVSALLDTGVSALLDTGVSMLLDTGVSMLLDADSTTPGVSYSGSTAILSIILTGHAAAVTTMAISANGHWLATGSADTTIHLWDLRNISGPAATPVVLTGHEGAITAMTVSPDGRWLVTGSGDSTVRLWDVSVLLDAGLALDPTDAAILLRSHEGAITAMTISPNGRWLVTGSNDNTARLWDVSTLLDTNVSTLFDSDSTAAGGTVAAPIVLRGHEDKIFALAISSDNHWLVTGSGDNTARLWDLSNVADTVSAGSVMTTSTVLRGHERPILDVVISPAPAGDTDTYWLVTTSGDGTARLWDLGNTPDPATSPVVLRGHERSVFAAAIRFMPLEDSADGQWLITAGKDNTVRLWTLRPDALIDLACRTAGRNFSQVEWAQYFAEQEQSYRKTCGNLPAHRSAIGAMVDRTAASLQTGGLQAGAADYAQVVTWAVESQDLYLNSLICWQGSLDGFAEIVLPTCEHAIQLAPGDGPLRDNRGLARALTGDYPGAVEDFKHFVRWSKENRLYELYGQRREAWIIELEAGRSPFDADLLEALRTE